MDKRFWNNGFFIYLSNFFSTIEMALINCEIRFTLIWSKNCFAIAGTAANQESTFTLTNTKLYVLVVTLSTHGNVELLKQFESGFKRTINWNKHKSTMTQQAQKRYLDFLTDPHFQGVNRLFVLSFKGGVITDGRISLINQ